MKWLAATIIIAAAAQAAQTNWPSAKAQPVEKPETGKAKLVTVDRFKIKADKKVDKDGKAAAREFPMMFDIASKAKKRKTKVDKEKAAK